MRYLAPLILLALGCHEEAPNSIPPTGSKGPDGREWLGVSGGTSEHEWTLGEETLTFDRTERAYECSKIDHGVRITFPASADGFGVPVFRVEPFKE